MKYNAEYLNALKKQKKVQLITLLISILLSLILLLIMFLTVTYKEESLIKTLSCILLTFIGWFAIYEIIFIIIPLKRKIEHLSLVLRSNLGNFYCDILDISKLKTITTSIKGYEIFCLIEGTKLRFYFHSDLGKVNFSIGDYVHLKVKNNFIVEYEVMPNE
jgi:hypothetical protein